MSLSESVARLKASKIQPVYHWWRGRDLVPMLCALGFTEEQCKEAGVGEKRLEVHLGLSIRGEPDAHFRVVDTRANARGGSQEFNISHPCPPDCPGDDAADASESAA